MTEKKNVYERNIKARQRCLEYYGPKCVVCGFEFGKFYGSEYEGFIHVHHIIPLSEIRDEYVVDPIKDLRPVCPNCHAILHTQNPPLKIEMLKKKIKILHDKLR